LSRGPCATLSLLALGVAVVSVSALSCAATPGETAAPSRPAVATPSRPAVATASLPGNPAFTAPDPSGLAPVPSHTLVVSIAGLSPRAYRSTSWTSAWMPNLAGLAADGAAADAVASVSPASPGPAHASLASGRTPSAHGLGADHPLGAQGVDAAFHREAAAIQAPTLWTAAAEAGASMALLGWPTTAGAEVEWLFPELIPARLGEASPKLLEGQATPELLDVARQLGADRPEAGFQGPARDAVLAGLACHVLTKPDPPRLTLLRFSQTEVPLWRAGPDSEATREAFARVDAALGQVLGCLAGVGRLEATALLVTGDVPVEPVHTLIQPNVALERAGLLVPGPGSRTGIRRWEALARSNGTSAFVYARDPEVAVLARAALREAAEQTLAYRVVSAEEMLALGADREAWFGLEAEPGFVFGDGLRGAALVLPSAARGAWGRLSHKATPDVGFVAWGAGIRVGVRIPVLRQTDVAPTVARLVGLVLDGSDGRPLVGMLRPPPPSVAAPRAGGRRPADSGAR